MKGLKISLVVLVYVALSYHNISENDISNSRKAQQQIKRLAVQRSKEE